MKERENERNCEKFLLGFFIHLKTILSLFLLPKQIYYFKESSVSAVFLRQKELRTMSG
jgi:hypothetical protein